MQNVFYVLFSVPPMSLQGLPLPRSARKGTHHHQVPRAAHQDLGHDTPGRGMRSIQVLITGMILAWQISSL